MNKLEDLFKLDPASPAFEAMRADIINSHLALVPEPHRAACIKLQEELDRLRETMPASDFMLLLSTRIQQNLADLQDQLHAVQALIEKDQPEKPRLKTIVGFSSSRRA